MIRNVLGSVLALVGAAAAVLSPFRHWYDGRLGREYGIGDPFTGITSGHPGVWGSILLFFLFTALLTVVGVLVRSRSLVAVAGLAVLGFTVLWMVRQGQAADGLAVTSGGSGLRWGVAGAAVGGVLTLLGAFLMSGRRGGGRRARRWPGGRRTPDEEYADEGRPAHGAHGAHDDPARSYRTPGAEHPDTWPPTQEPGPSVQTSTLPEPERDPYTGPEPRTGPPPAPGPSPESPGPGDQDTAHLPPVTDEEPGAHRPPRD
ncbi:hypothetical protein [Streptomyces sp. PTD5-9]|uniref:hypothetical protein n=1 Tax=Streptomyces sp. PTD5-9 TaxID=3120150 RepID=UPI00300BCB45